MGVVVCGHRLWLRLIYWGNIESKKGENPRDEISSTGKRYTMVYWKWASARAVIGHFLPFYTRVLCSPCLLGGSKTYPGSLVSSTLNRAI